MYNGIGLRTVRGSGTNGYVQRNLSHVDASRTRQALKMNRMGGSLGGYDAHGGSKNRPPPNADILLHEKKRKVELQLLELTLEMEERGCEPEDIQEKVKQERERLLARLNGEDRGRENANDVESSHARQKRKDEDNRRIKNAFGIASDYVAGESFDPEKKERRRQERKERIEQEWKEREEARKLRIKDREEKDVEMKPRLERPRSRSESRLASPCRRSRSPANCRIRALDDDASRKDYLRSSVKGRGSSRSSKPPKRKRRSVSSSRSRSVSSSGSGGVRSRPRSRMLKKGTSRAKDTLPPKAIGRSRPSRACNSSDSSSGSESERDCHRSRGKRTKAAYVGKDVPIIASPAQSAVLKGEHKVLNLSGRPASVSALTNDGSPGAVNGCKESKLSAFLSAPAANSKGVDSRVMRQEEKHKACPRNKMEKNETSHLIHRPDRPTKEAIIEAVRSPRRSRVPPTDPLTQSRKRRQRSDSPPGQRRRGRSTSTASSNASHSLRRRRLRSHSESRSRSVSSKRSRSHSSASSRSRSRNRSTSRVRRRSSPRGNRRSPSRSRSFGRRKFRNRR